MSKNPNAQDYKGFLIMNLSDGFFSLDEYGRKNGVGTVFYVENPDIKAHFIFSDNVVDPINAHIEDTFFNILAEKTIKKYIDTGAIANNKEYLFEWREGEYRLDKQSSWWKKARTEYKFS